MNKVLTMVIDGFGFKDSSNGNAIKNARMPNYMTLLSNYSHSLLNASGRSIGLPNGETGNSEIGLMTIGSGRLIKQKNMQLEYAFKNDEFKNSRAFNDLVNYVKDNEKALQIISLCSNELNYNMILKMIDRLHVEHVSNIVIHLITRNENIDNFNLYNNINEISKRLAEYDMGIIASVCGRHYALAENNWNNLRKYSDLITKGIGAQNSIQNYLNECYKYNLNNDSLPPLIIDKNKVIKNGDGILLLNYENEGLKEIIDALTNINFEYYETIKLDKLKIFTMFEASFAVNYEHLLTKDKILNPLGVYLADLGLSQARIADVVKYMDISYFFDGGANLKLDNCDYYINPNYSGIDIIKQIIKCIDKDYDFILVNYSNIDIVGQTGNYAATIKAIEEFDKCLGKIYQVCQDNFYTMFILGAYPNVEEMIDNKHRSLNHVPFMITDNNVSLIDGDLTQVAPTILKYMDIAVPKEMNETGDLFYKENN